MSSKTERVILSGNAAFARGAWEAGVKFAAAYPGTPSTEILEYCGTYQEIDAQWAVNEKTALETAIGAAYGGVRTLNAQKHVGLNVAADPFFTASYTGINGGLVIVSADDPGLHSSQNEQDNRYYAKMVKMPMFEPSSSQEAKDMMIAAFDVSEQHDTPVLIRSTTRVSHSEGVVELGPRKEVPDRGFVRNYEKYVVLPNNARKLHAKVEERQKTLARLGESSPFNRIESGSKELGIITSGISYQYAREVFPDASFLKLGQSYPLPEGLIRTFAGTVKTLVVIEENDPFLEEQVKALGIACHGKDLIPICGELNPDILQAALKDLTKTPACQPLKLPAVAVPGRPPVLCPGCPHRGVFYLFRKLDLNVTGDIGCYTLGAFPPHNAIHTCVCMGASITNSLGIRKANGKKMDGKLVAVIGESTFIHSGITGLIDTVYNQGCHLTVILDNSITAMTGHQPNPASGKTLKGKDTKALNLTQMVRATGVEQVREVDPFDMKLLEDTMKELLAIPEPTVLITKRPCILLKGYKPVVKKVSVNRDKCVKCGMCWKMGCPAIEKDPVDSKTRINTTLCVNCGLCARVCRPKAITQES